MCGIFCNIGFENDHSCQENSKLLANNSLQLCEGQLKNRGPDLFNSISFESKCFCGLFYGSVLWLQGPEPVAQPIENDTSIFLFNGDIFGGKISHVERQRFGDTRLVLKIIEQNPNHIVDSFSSLYGPYSFIYLDKRTSKLYFARDPFGRRSLLLGYDSKQIVLTSAAPKCFPLNLLELPAIGVFCFDLTDKQLHLNPWNKVHQNFDEKLKEIETSLNCPVEVFSRSEFSNFCDSTSRLITPSKDLSFVRSSDCCGSLKTLLECATWKSNVESLRKLLEKSVYERISTRPEFCKECLQSRAVCQHAQVGILFSGGVDCAILAVIAHQFIDPSLPIDLLNVAFEHKTDSYNTPDRITSREALKILQEILPARQWNLVEINVSKDELETERSRVISNLIHPLRTILDESLGCAFWFASRGKSSEYISPCRVLLIGTGADELFGGYSRHKAAFKNENWLALEQVLDQDWRNISHRNLARDDRVISDHGRQLRTPYLDEDVVQFARSLPAWEKCYPIDNNIGCKLLLRVLAFQLQLGDIATFRKRAVQFGSRIANSAENANEISPRL